MRRTLDDHVRAVSDAVDRVHAASGHGVHLAGYSQGGMFCYQTAAYRRSENVASIITFGSPVDIHQNLPVEVSEKVAEKVLGGLRALIERPLNAIDGLPGFLTSFAFKMVSPRKEAEQLVDFVRSLHDRQALEKRESRRKFLGGEGFVAWPGPALRTFIDEFIVNNRLASGGFVIDGRTVSLADISCPILFFVGLRDDIARPASVRAIRTAAFNSDVHELPMRAGHLGLVVGSRALTQTWPTVTGWIRWCEGGALPEILCAPEPRPIDDIDDEDFELDIDIEDVYGFASNTVEDILRRFAGMGDELTQAIDAMRWQVPRLSQLRKIRSDTRISSGAGARREGGEDPEATFFLWKGRAFSYGDADRRVDAVVRGLIECGVSAKERVGVLMNPRPTYLTIVTALNRVGATAVLLSPDMQRVGAGARDRDERGGASRRRPRKRGAREGSVRRSGPRARRTVLRHARSDAEGVTDMERIRPERIRLPSWYEPNPGRAADEAMILFTAGRQDQPRAARITNRRWAFSAFGAAAAALSTRPTPCTACSPLHHAAGMLVAVGGALVGGARLALSAGFDADAFWGEARRYGASVVFLRGRDVPRAGRRTARPDRRSQPGSALRGERDAPRCVGAPPAAVRSGGARVLRVDGGQCGARERAR